MISGEDSKELNRLLILCVLEGFFFGLYSGLFAIYLQCPSKDSRTATIVFYVLCLLYVVTAATVVSDILSIVLEARIFTLSPQLQLDSLSIAYRIAVTQYIASGCNDFIAQCVIIYRCWIVWGKNIRVVIIPSFLAITYIATWLAQVGAITPFSYRPWGTIMTLTGLAASMAVNTLVTGLIVFRILKVFLEVKATVERTLDPLAKLSSARGAKLRRILFILIESGMALFVIQLIRLVLTSLPLETSFTSKWLSSTVVIALHEMLNGIAPTIILVRVSMGLSFDDEESFKGATGSLLNISSSASDPNTLQRGRSSYSMPPHETRRSEDTI